MAVFHARDETGGVTREEAQPVAGTVVPQVQGAAKTGIAEAPSRPLPAPMPPAQRLSVIWLREARKG